MNNLKEFLPLLLFDGECIFCNRLIQFILRHQKNPDFFFSSLQSAVGQLVRQNTESMTVSESLLVVTAIIETRPVVYSKSPAVWFILARLKYPWRLVVVFRLIPRFISDRLYDLVAAYRYKIWGREEHCLIPDPSYQQRFIDNIEIGTERS
jgi:predicted DCC family thiol-disulfide oxidoreductase YuxK